MRISDWSSDVCSSDLPLTLRVRPSGCACAVIAAMRPTLREPVERGWSPPPRQEPQMSNSLKTAQAYAWSLARSLMVCIIVFRAENGMFGAMPTTEWDGDPDHLLPGPAPFGR